MAQPGKWCAEDGAPVLAEGVGFEPTIRLPVYTLSKRAPSATRPSLRLGAGPPVRANIEAGAPSASGAAGRCDAQSVVQCGRGGLPGVGQSSTQRWASRMLGF